MGRLGRVDCGLECLVELTQRRFFTCGAFEYTTLRGRVSACLLAGCARLLYVVCVNFVRSY